MKRGARLILAMLSLALPATAPAGVTTTYTYDALGRLVAASTSGEVTHATNVSYDPAGNRISYTASGGSGQGPIVVDGSFETPPLASGYVSDPIITGMTFTNWSGITAYGSDWGYAHAPDGAQAAFFDTPDPSHHAGITMAVSGLTAGATYQVSFMLARRPLYGLDVLRVSVDGTMLGDYTPVSTTTSFTTFTTPSFTATGTTATLSFASIGLGDVALDKVTIAPTPPPAVADGSFETPPLASGYVSNPTITGLTFTGWSGITAYPSDWTYVHAPDGAQAAFFDTPDPSHHAGITMAISGLTPGASYRISFMLARRPLYGLDVLRVSVDGTTLGDYTPDSTTNSFTAFTTPAFTATGTTATLSFASIGLGDVALDKVTVGP
jgi:YD repeat-containing protein